MADSIVYTKMTPITVQTLIKVVEQTGDSVMITDNTGRIQYVNDAFQKTTGYSKAELLGKNPRILKSGKQGSGYYHRLWSTILAGQTFRAQTVNKNKFGEFYVADQTITPIVDDEGNITHFVSVWKDKTEKMRLQEQLKREKLKLEKVVGFDEKVSKIRKFDTLVDFVVEKTAKILNARKCSIMLLDRANDELVLKGAFGLDHPNMIKGRVPMGESVSGMVALTGKGLFVQNIETDKNFQRPNRKDYDTPSFMCIPIKVHDRFIGVMNVADKNFHGEQIFDATDYKIFKDVAREVAVAVENVKLYKELKYLTAIDPLTKIYNFRFFKKSLAREIHRSQRYKGELGLMMVDIDNLKSYNDHFGHTEGSQLIKTISMILNKNLRAVDITCRYGGDEFAVILPETDVAGAEIAAQKILDHVMRHPFKGPVSVSIGLAMRGRKMDECELILKADQALFQAKRNGKNRVIIYK